MVLIANVYMSVDNEIENIAIVINLEIINYRFADFSVFTGYKKFDTSLTERIAEKKTSFIIAD